MLRVFLLAVFMLGFSVRLEALYHACKSSSRPNYVKRLEKYGVFNYTHSVLIEPLSGGSSEGTAAAVQQLFDQGMALAAGYNQAEARRSFRAALELDNLCAMCWWGVAYARGPFQNKFALARPRNDPELGAYYSRHDTERAAMAIGYAAALAGLLRHNETNIIMAAVAAQLQARLAQQGQQGAQQEQGQQGQDSAVKRLMARLPNCTAAVAEGVASTGGAGNGGGHRLRRQQRRSAAEMNAAAGPVRAGLLQRDQYYIAAMFDRLAVRRTSGVLWREAELRFAEDMKAIATCFPDDADALALAAEALANLHPWDFVVNGTVADGVPRNSTVRVIGLLHRALARNPNQPLALHLMIHATEELPARMLPKPTSAAADSAPSTSSSYYVAGLGLESARRLAGMFPSLDHMQHMPSHTFARLGLWDEAMQSNILALRASVSASWSCMSPLYPDHNAGMLVFAASMAGEYGKARVYGRVLRELPRLVPDADPGIARLWPQLLLVDVLFANWSRVAADPPPPVDDTPLRTALADLHSRLQTQLDTAAATDAAIAAGGDGAGGGGSGEALVDVLREPELDEELLAAVMAGYAGSSRGGGVRNGGGDAAVNLPAAWQDTDYALKSVVGAKDAAGPHFPAAVWLFAQAMALANRLHEIKLTASDPRVGASPPPAPAPPTPPAPPPLPLGILTDKQAGSLVDQIAASMQGGVEGGSGVGAEGERGAGGVEGGGAVAEMVEKVEKLLEELLMRLRAVWEAMPEDPRLPPGPGLGVTVPGYGNMTELLVKMADARAALASAAAAGGGGGGAVNATAVARALQALREAVAAEDAAGYTEPPRLGPQPVRQCLGWVLLQQGRYEEAVQAYSDDLDRYPRNAWSLVGLQRLKDAMDREAAEMATTAPGGAALGGDPQQLRLKAAYDRVGELLQLHNSIPGAVPAVVEHRGSSCPAFHTKPQLKRR